MIATKPTVSVIIPVYNAQDYVAEAVHSVLASTYADFEVICMDDGSADRSLTILQELALEDPRIKVLHEENAGVCHARNTAIREAQGKYILPVDADNRISPTFLAEAVSVLDADPEVKAVVPRAEFFGERTGEWRLPPFSLSLLARKNMMDTCALYRRSDWERVGGYCEEIIAREDWEFWISVLQDGGRVVRLTGETGLYYRVRSGSKRETDRQLKRHVINVLNRRHQPFFERELGGPLRYRRTWSRLINHIVRLLNPRRTGIANGYEGERYFLRSLPYLFRHTTEGHVIYKGRNELRLFHDHGFNIVVKAFCRPNLINRIVYGFLRSSKAERSCRYAERLRALGIGSPAPVGFVTIRHGLLFADSYYASLQSELPYTYIDLIKGHVPQTEAAMFLLEIGRTAGRLHEAGIIHRDFSRGNLLLGMVEGEPRVELVDLNRLRFHAINLSEGVKGFSRLPATEEMKRLMAEGYAEIRNFSLDEILALWPETEELDSPEAGVRG